MDKRRIILDIIGLLSVFLLPWYITILFLLVLLFVYEYYPEVMALSLVADLVFMDFNSAHPFPMFLTIVATVLTLLMLSTRKYFIFKHK